MKTKEELNALKNEVEALNAKLAELTEDELVQVTGGLSFDDENGFIFDAGDSFDFGRWRYRVPDYFTSKSMFTTISVQAFIINGSQAIYVGLAEMAVGQLVVLTRAGRYAEDGKTKIE